MATENFTTYTEADSDNNRIEVKENCITWDDMCALSEDDYNGFNFHVYKLLSPAITSTDDFRHEFSFHITAVNVPETYPDTVWYQLCVYALSSTNTGDLNQSASGITAGVWLRHDNTVPPAKLYVRYNIGSIYCIVTINPFDTAATYYVTVARDANGGINSRGQYSLIVCSDNFYSQGGTPIGSVTCDVARYGTKLGFTYVYGLCTDSVTTFDSDGHVCLLDLSSGLPTTFIPQIWIV